MKRAISSFILRLFGWTVEVDVPDYPKCVICVAPHTSNWDFFIGKLAYLSIGRYAGFMMKKEWFFPPLGSLLTSMGGVPVSRDRHTGMPIPTYRNPAHRRQKTSQRREKPLFFHHESSVTADRKISQFPYEKVPITGMGSHTDNTLRIIGDINLHRPPEKS